MEENCLVFIEESMGVNYFNESLNMVLKKAYLEFKIPMNTMSNWWTHFLEWGEYPFETRQRKKDILYLMKAGKALRRAC